MKFEQTALFRSDRAALSNEHDPLASRRRPHDLSRSPDDYLIAAAAELTGLTGLTVLHYDATYETVASRPSANAERIVVLEHGQIVEQGTHDELDAEGRYWQLYRDWAEQAAA